MNSSLLRISSSCFFFWTFFSLITGLVFSGAGAGDEELAAALAGAAWDAGFWLGVEGPNDGS